MMSLVFMFCSPFVFSSSGLGQYKCIVLSVEATLAAQEGISVHLVAHAEVPYFGANRGDCARSVAFQIAH
jgi:hypothetical protein